MIERRHQQSGHTAQTSAAADVTNLWTSIIFLDLYSTYCVLMITKDSVLVAVMKNKVPTNLVGFSCGATPLFSKHRLLIDFVFKHVSIDILVNR